MAVKILAFGVPVDSNVGAQTDGLATPNIRPVSTADTPDASGQVHSPQLPQLLVVQQRLLQASLLPESLRKRMVLNLEPIIDAHSLAALWPPWRGLQREGLKECDVVPAERLWEERRDEGYLGCRRMKLWSQINDGQWRLKLGPIGRTRRWNSLRRRGPGLALLR